MTSITATTSASCIARAGLLGRGAVLGVSSSSPILGLPAMASRRGGIRCCAEKGSSSSGVSTKNNNAAVASLMAAASAAAMSSPAAMALVDERMSTEGTGLPFGLSNNLLGWILFGVFGLIWAGYFTYTATLEEDEESGLSL